ncbi:MAG: Ribonuclease G [Candidatus Kapaibacterium sp.]|jgi:ribonuclease G|nr:MAG: Ribonuclease G [Candidatus Kapabacteria bacterium]ROL58555.1 MAG: Rne/Rng family ribonuclease [Bacteroidetes/Chlorobi group bacterium Naka2016]
MKKVILINSAINENRIAITEDGKLAEYFVETPDKEKYVGNIYLGRITRILPSLNAAFVDIGLKQNAFLHFSDVDERFRQIIWEEEGDAFNENGFERENSVINEIDSMLENLNEKNGKSSSKPNNTRKRQENLAINLNLKLDIKENQLIPVQVVREAFANKGVKVTTRISIPGRYLVLVPDFKIIGVSRKIHSPQERRRLRSLAAKITNKEFGCIIRTAAVGRDLEDFESDWANLKETWEKIQKKIATAKEPMLLYKDMELTTSIIRDLFRNDVDKVIVDSKKLYKEIVEYLEDYSPEFIERVELYKGKTPLFDYYQIEKDIELTKQRKVPLPSGGSIIIDQTEAMFIIDVNSGKLVSEATQEINAFRTNMEAVNEIARQIRLRDLAGIIIVDFIDMHDPINRKKIYYAMRRAMKKDRAKAVVFPLTELSLMQITRQRINLNISEKVTEVCPLCKGLGRIPTKAEVLTKIERWLKNFKSKAKEFRLRLYVHPHIAEYLTEGNISRLTKLMLKYFVRIKLVIDESLPIDQFKFESVKQSKDITKEFLEVNYDATLN